MKIIRAGYNNKHPADFKIIRKAGTEFHLMLVIKSAAYVVLNGKKHILPPHSVIIYKAGTPQFYGAVEEAYINDWVYFDMPNEEYDKYFMDGICFDTIFFSVYVSELSSLIKRIFTEFLSQNKYKDDSCGLYMRILFLKLSEAINMSETKRTNPYYHEFLKIRSEIYYSPEKNWTIDYLAKKLSLSRSYIQHLYKIFFDTTISEDITNSRIEQAKYLLFTTDIKISAISKMCGYNSDVHFMRTFKKATGVTPSQYKKQPSSI